jgi:hypothetical protein
MSVEELPDVRLPQPAVDAAADLDADDFGNDLRTAEPSRQVNLSEPAFAEETVNAVMEE